MVTLSSRTVELKNQFRRSLNKSRQGCRNCKLRKVKCDETKPECERCMSFGVSCNYDRRIPDLEPCFRRPLQVTSPQKPLLAVNQSFVAMIDDNLTFPVRESDRDLFSKFQCRTVSSTGTIQAALIFQRQGLRLACSRPYLMHALQGLTAIHDRYLSPSPTPAQRVNEAFHLSQAVRRFNLVLSTSTVAPEDRDAIFATASILGIVTVAHFDATCPEAAWPIKASEPSDLEWLRMCHGKEAIWNLADPSRHDSIFCSLVQQYETAPTPVSAIEGIPADIVELCGLDEWSTADNSPYYLALRSLVPLLQLECNDETIGHHFAFCVGMPSAFEALLEIKDPRALLLMALWYANVCRSQWWLARRAMLECQATCLYLERHHADQMAVQHLLQYPKMRCGLPS